MALLTTSPGQPSLLAGFLNLRGTAVPVIRLSRLFHLEDGAPQLYTPLLILDCDGLPVALEAEGVDEVAEVEEGEMRELGERHSLNECAEAVFTLNGRDVLMLSCDLLLLAKEQECLRELQVATQQRLDALGSTAR